MDFSISQITNASVIPEVAASPLSLVKGDFSNPIGHQNVQSYPGCSDEQSIFQTLPESMYSKNMAGYSTEDFSRACFPYVPMSTVNDTISSFGNSFLTNQPVAKLPDSGIPDSGSTHSAQASAESYECTNVESFPGCYFSNVPQSYENNTEQSKIITNQEMDPYIYDSILTFKDPKDVETGAHLNSGLTDWVTPSGLPTSSADGLIQPSDASSSASNAYPQNEPEGLLDCTNRNSTSKAYEPVDHGLSISQSEEQQSQMTQQEVYQDPSTAYLAHNMAMTAQHHAQYPPNVTCTQAGFIPTMFPYQGMTGGFQSHDPSATLGDLAEQNYLFGRQTGSGMCPDLTDCGGDLGGSQTISMAYESSECDIDKGLYSRELDPFVIITHLFEP